MELMWDEKRVLALANWRNEGGVYQEGEEQTHGRQGSSRGITSSVLATLTLR